MATLANVITKLSSHDVTALSDVFVCTYNSKEGKLRSTVCMRVLEAGLEYVLISEGNIHHPGTGTYILCTAHFSVPDIQDRVTIICKAEHLQYSHMIEWLTSFFKAYKKIG